jgi:hypothetical protein
MAHIGSGERERHERGQENEERGEDDHQEGKALGEVAGEGLLRGAVAEGGGKAYVWVIVAQHQVDGVLKDTQSPST